MQYKLGWGFFDRTYAILKKCTFYYHVSWHVTQSNIFLDVRWTDITT
jgi:hypothetical protein